MRRVWSSRRLRLAGCAAAGAGAALAAAVALAPSPVPKLEAMRTSTAVFDRESRLLRAFLGRGDQRAIYVPLSQISPHLIRATIDVEDKRFRWHFGVDPMALARAAAQDLCAGRVVSGASTLTMQLARLMEPKPRTLRSKVIEAFRALQLEWALSKDQILEYYLNFAPYGGNLVGAEAAARRYFGKPASALSLAEAALLAGLPQSPSRLRPDRWPARALRRRRAVLRAMRDAGDLTDAQRAALERAPLRLAAEHPRPRAPHFAQWVVDRLGPGRSYRTTLDWRLQEECERLAAAHVARLRRRGATNAAVVVIENASGAVRAMVGSADFFDAAARGQVNAALAWRSPGSALKPFTYALAFARGVCAPDTMLPDIPCAFGGYSPVNYDGRFRGPVRAADALALSLNVPAVRLLHALGAGALKDLLRACEVGLRAGRGEPGLALTLGAADVRLADLTNAYAMLARLGVYRPLSVLEGRRGLPRRVLPRAACYLVADALRRREPGPAFALKTGTSQGRRDAWAFAFNPEWTVGVWVGDMDGRPARVLVGARAAAPLAARIFARLYPDAAGPWYRRPPRVAARRVCALSGMPAGPNCPATREGLFIKGVSPCRPCCVHVRALVDDATGDRLCPRCAAARPHHEETFVCWPPALRAWLLARGRAPRLPPRWPGCRLARRGRPPRILSPQDGKTYARPAAAAAPDAARLLFAAGLDDPREPVCWFVDGALFRRAAGGERVFWPLRAGRHTVTCVDAAGRGASAAFVVE